MHNKDAFYGGLAAYSMLGLIFALFSPRGLIFSSVALLILASTHPRQVSPPVTLASHPIWEEQLMAAGRNGNYLKALSIANQYLKTHPDSCEALHWRFQIYNAMGNNTAALQNINQKCMYY